MKLKENIETNLRDELYRSTTSGPFWICMIEGRVMVGEGVRSRGKCAWKRKSDAAQVFKYSSYWHEIVRRFKAAHPGVDWYRREGEWMLKQEYQRLLKEGIVKYYEVKPVPDWVNI